MQLEPQDTVYYIYNNLIYKGVITEQVQIEDDYEIYYRVNTHHGLQIMPWWALKDTVEELSESIMHESCWGVLE
jgi:hypothetical protein